MYFIALRYSWLVLIWFIQLLLFSLWYIILYSIFFDFHKTLLVYFLLSLFFHLFLFLFLLLIVFTVFLYQTNFYLLVVQAMLRLCHLRVLDNRLVLSIFNWLLMCFYIMLTIEMMLRNYWALSACRLRGYFFSFLILLIFYIIFSLLSLLCIFSNQFFGLLFHHLQ